MSVMTVLVFANVVGRYVFGVSFGWTEELSRFAMIWTAFLGAGLALRYGQLVSVDAVQGLFPRTAELWLRGATALVIAAFLVALVWLGLQFVEFSWRNRTPVLRIPRGYPYLAIPIGAAFALVHLALGFRAYLRRDWMLLEELDLAGPDDPAPRAAGDAAPGPGAAAAPADGRGRPA